MKLSNVDAKSSVFLSSENYANSRKILIIGFGVALVLHVGLITGIRYWWKPVANDNEIEITMVEPADIAEVLPAVKTDSSTPMSQVELGNSTSASSSPKMSAIRSDSTFSSSQPNPISKPKQSTPKQPNSRSTQKTSKIVKTTIPPKKIQTPPQTTPQPPTESPEVTNSLPSSWDNPEKQQSNNSIPASTPIEPSALPKPKKIDRTPKQTNSNSIPAKITPPTKVSKIATQENPSTKTESQQNNNPSNPSNESSSNNNRLGNSQGDSPNKNSTSSVGNNRSSPTGKNDPNSGGTSNSNNSATNTNTITGTPAQSGGGKSTLQCIKNCQLTKLQDLEDSDGGKDRLRIRIVVDPNGLVLEAYIAKSSGNSQIDSVVLEGIKKMEFAPSGKMIKGTVKANIFI
jgi:TonB family protein